MPGSSVTYVGKAILEIDGQSASEELMQDILEISVEESLHLPGMFTIIIENSYFPGDSDNKAWKHEKVFEIGKQIKISFASTITGAQEFSQQKEGSVLEGEITGIEAHFSPSSQAPIIVRGYDISHRLHRGRYNRSFQNCTDSDIVKKIAGEIGIPTAKVDSTGGPHGYSDINGQNGYVFQENQTNMEFLRELAARNGFELFIQDGKLNFRKPKADQSIDLIWLENLHSFRVRVSNSEQVKEVEVRGWDYSKKTVITSQKTTEQVLSKNTYGLGSKTSSAFKGQPPNPKMIVVDQPIYDSVEAAKIAQGLCNELGGEFIVADGIGNGNPEIRPGRLVKLEGMGKYWRLLCYRNPSSILPKNLHYGIYRQRFKRWGYPIPIITPNPS
jgi:phage protein D